MSWTWGRSQNGQRSPDDSLHHHLCEGSRCQVPATDSQQGLQVGVDLLQVVEPLVPGKQHFQMLITSKLDHKLIERRREEEKLLWGCSLYIHIFSLVQQHPCLVVVPLLILLLYKFYPKIKTKITSVPSLSLSLSLSHMHAHMHTHTYTCNHKHTIHTHTHTHTHTQKE